MSNDVGVENARAGRVSSELQRVLRQLPVSGLERQAIEAGEIDAVIDYGNANVIVFPAARRALRDNAKRAAAAERKATLGIPQRNSVLAALPRAEYRRLLPALEQVMLKPGDVLHEAAVPIRYVYFPVDCVICLLTQIDGEQVFATGLIGHEGMVGIPVALGIGTSPVRAVVEVAGTALRVGARRFTNELRSGLHLQRLLYSYAQAKLNQARQIAACIASHHFQQRLACWLLMISDRAESPDMHLTHEHLAAVLNVRRESVTATTGALRARGLIDYSRGRISILDRAGLAAESCGCYQPIERASSPKLRLPGAHQCLPVRVAQ